MSEAWQLICKWSAWNWIIHILMTAACANYRKVLKLHEQHDSNGSGVIRSGTEDETV